MKDKTVKEQSSTVEKNQAHYSLYVLNGNPTYLRDPFSSQGVGKETHPKKEKKPYFSLYMLNGFPTYFATYRKDFTCVKDVDKTSECTSKNNMSGPKG